MMLIGPIVRLTLAGDEMMILSDPEDCEELVITKGFTFRNVLLTLTKVITKVNKLFFSETPSLCRQISIS